ncbi:hypothetical protein B7463_g12549, partial [Scytalidium lignicola]
MTDARPTDYGGAGGPLQSSEAPPVVRQLLDRLLRILERHGDSIVKHPLLEILYTLPTARIVSFTTSIPNSGSSPVKDSPRREPEPGSLSWTSRFERTIAVGPLRIYKAPGSVAFLSCNSALRPILPKSQCWCVDESSSRFILQIRRPQYWRIEISNQSSEDEARSEQLKTVLESILLFEKTPCPFRRNFTVDLPEPPETPVRKRPWRPAVRQLPEPAANQLVLENAIDEESPTRGRESPFGPVKGGSNTATLSSTTPGFSKPQPDPLSQLDVLSVNISPPAKLSKSALSGSEDDVPSVDDASENPESEADLTPRNRVQQTLQVNLPDRELPGQTCFQQPGSRRVATVPILSLVTGSPSKETVDDRPKDLIGTDIVSTFSSSVDSFHSTMSWQTPLPPPSPPASPTTAYPYPHDNIVLPKRQCHNKDASERTVTPSSSRVWEVRSAKSTECLRSLSPQTPSMIQDFKDNEKSNPVVIPEPQRTLRHRATTITNSNRRTLSPLPAAVNLFSPPRRARHLQTARHLPTAIVQKTCEILLSPPSHLFHLMIRVASRIAAGEWRGFLSGPGEAFHWDVSEDEYVGGECIEDDFGVSLSSPPISRSGSVTHRSGGGGSWEVD